MALQIAIDRGGTFTDVWYKNKNSGRTATLKLLSEDPMNYKDAPFEAIRRIVENELKISQPLGSKIDFKHIDWIRMGTTVATNALLERKGEPCVLVITKGFKDLLHIGNQSRPNIFDLEIKMPEMLYSEVVEVEERILLPHKKCQLINTGKIVEGRNGEKVIIRTALNEDDIKQKLKTVYNNNIRSVAVVLAHSYIYPDHEVKVGKIAKEIGFTQISLSSTVMPMIKMVPRGFTVTADAYLTPCIKRYINGFCVGFSGLLSNETDDDDDGKMDEKHQPSVLFMQSDGGLAPMSQFMGSRAVLSGPAGGVVGYAQTTFIRAGGDKPVVGFDMGGTSTDVSRYGGGPFEHVFESVTAGVELRAPQLDVHTVAAGGGSCLEFREKEGWMEVGPESAGAHPGPVCYRKQGGKLAVTDANLVLGRLLVHHFPKIFGPEEKDSLDFKGAYEEMERVTQKINSVNNCNKSVEDIALGFIRIANEAMCRPIRALTQGRGYDTSRHILACFGGAGGQHACAVARALGMKKVFVHRYSGILSAYGLALADVVTEVQEPCGLKLKEGYKEIVYRLEQLCNRAKDNLLKQGFTVNNIRLDVFLNMRFHGTDCALMISCGTEDDLHQRCDRCLDIFLTRYKSEFGFVLHNRAIIVDDVRVRGSGLSGIAADDADDLMGVGSNSANSANSANNMDRDQKPIEYVRVYFESGWIETPVYRLADLKLSIAAGSLGMQEGPAIIVDANSTVLVEPDCQFRLTRFGDLEIDVGRLAVEHPDVDTRFDAIQLSIFSHRFMSIAEQMGKVLQRTAISTNIKERLDFSCAVFGPDGGLVANAPHIPVHLGAMQHTVQYQMQKLNVAASGGGGGGKSKLGRHDVLLTNHPQSGGSHLPDLTVITPVFLDGIAQPIFYLANRGHHADIGGSTPGSMPPMSKSIYEEGAVFKTFFLIKDGIFQEKELIEALQHPGTYSGCSGSRNISDNLSDLRAQVAANEKGRNLVMDLIKEYGLDVVQAYMLYIQDNAELAVRNLLKTVARGSLSKDDDSIVSFSATDYLDSGSKIALSITINANDGTAEFDFTGSSYESITNLNAPRAITQSCLIYCLRSMVGHDVPLNQGCLRPITLIIPEDSILDPRDDSPVVGGNVQTSQRIVDVIFKSFGNCAASQGCMNNVTFGDSECGYYETVAGGAGAGPGWHGRSGVHTHMTNTRITDLEILESRYPVILERFGLRPNSGGTGQYNGGLGVDRWLKFRSPMTVSLLTERRVFAPYGSNGGGDGVRGLNLLIRNTPVMQDVKDDDGDNDDNDAVIRKGALECRPAKQRRFGGRVIDLGSKISVDVKPEDELRISTPGGGGWGCKEPKK